MQDDPIIAEIRQIRAQLMREANNDPRQLAENARIAAERLGFKPLTVEQSRELLKKNSTEAAKPASGKAKSA